MLVIRLARGGRKKYPVYRIVSADKRRAATGKFIDVLGHYNPHSKELVLKQDEIAQLVKNGAQPSDAVLRLMQKDGMELPKWAEITVRNRKPKKEPEAAPEKLADEAEASDAPAEEAPVEPADAEVAAEATEAKEEVAEEDHNVDTAETEAPTEKAEEVVEAAADAAIETAQSEAEVAPEAPAAEEKPAEEAA